MGFRHVLNMTIIVVMVFLANSNSLSFASDDFLFPDAEMSFDGELLAFNSPDTLGPLSSNTNNDDIFSSQSDSVNLDEPFELAGCSSFENIEDLPVIGKSRSRRSGSSCTNPGAGAGPLKSESEFEFSGGGSLRMWGEEGIHERRNGQCLLMTAGSLPWGVCYKPTESPLVPMGTSIVPQNSGRVVSSFFLSSCTLGTSMTKLISTQVD